MFVGLAEDTFGLSHFPRQRLAQLLQDHNSLPGLGGNSSATTGEIAPRVGEIAPRASSATTSYAASRLSHARLTRCLECRLQCGHVLARQVLRAHRPQLLHGCSARRDRLRQQRTPFVEEGGLDTARHECRLHHAEILNLLKLQFGHYPMKKLKTKSKPSTSNNLNQRSMSWKQHSQMQIASYRNNAHNWKEKADNSTNLFFVMSH